MTYSLGYSPCPNDCFIFYALAHKKVASELDVSVQLEDVEALNQLAKRAALDVTKISYHAFGHFSQDYIMLRSGGALGRGVGPLIVTRERLTSLSNKTVATPGGLTTANLLLKLSQPDDIVLNELRYDQIMPAVAEGRVDAGLIIHESRFTYANYGLHKFLDLGEWWEQETGAVIPLGGIMAKRSLGADSLQALDSAVRASLEYAYAQPVEAQDYVAEHAQEMSAEVRQKHIDLYVNDFSLDIAQEGQRAVALLFEQATARGLLPELKQPLFLAS
jgi:1,4-dihydroxy-6-naphthoate synthase